jgi:hypothetical protein
MNDKVVKSYGSKGSRDAQFYRLIEICIFPYGHTIATLQCLFIGTTSTYGKVLRNGLLHVVHMELEQEAIQWVFAILFHIREI